MTDLHLNKQAYKSVMSRNDSLLPFRIVDFMNAFSYMVDECVNKIKPDLVVIGGDVYDTDTPNISVRKFFNDQISKLLKAKIPLIILTGNHDINRKNHALQDLQELKLKTVLVIDKPTITVYKDTQLFLFPYSLEVEQQKIAIKDEFNNFVQEIHAKKDGKPSIFFGHFGVRGAAINEYSEDVDIDVNEDEITNTTTTAVVKKDYKNTNKDDIDCDDLDSIGADYVILGDYHKHQTLNTKKCIAMYAGSIEKTTFSEISQKKGFVVYNSDAESKGKMGKCSFVEYPNCRPMLELKGNFIDFKAAFKKIDYSKYSEAIVKLKFIGTKAEDADLSAGLESFKKEIREKINPVHIDLVKFKVNDEEQIKEEQEATKLENTIMESGHLSNADVIAGAKEEITGRVKDQQEAILTINLADEIYQETVQKMAGE